MKRVSTLVLSAVLLAGGLSLATTPALAKDKKEKKVEAPKPPPISKEFLPAAQAAQKAMQEKKYDAALTAINGGADKAKSPYEKFLVEQFRLLVAINKGDLPGQKKAIGDLLATGGTPADEIGKYSFYAGRFAYQDREYANAIKYWIEADKAGYAGMDYVAYANAHFQTKNFQAGSPLLKKAIAIENKAGKVAEENWYRVAIQEAQKSKLTAEADEWLTAYVRAYPTPKAWNLALDVFRSSGKMDPQLQLDTFRLTHDVGALSGAQDYYDYAAVATERGMPGEAKAILEEGYTKNAISRTQPQLRERLADAEGKIPADKAGLPGQITRSGTSADGKLAFNTANALIGYGENAKALELLELAEKKGGPIDMNTLQLRKGMLLNRLGRAAEARTAFTKVAGGQQKTVADFWLLFLETKK